MRVLYLIQYFTTPEESGSARAYDLVRHLARRGHEVTVVAGALHYHARRRRKESTRLFSHERHGSLRLIRVGWLLPYGQRMAFRWLNYLIFPLTSTLAAVLYAGRVDVVVASSTPLTIGIPGILLALWKRAAFVFEVRDLWPGWLVEFGLVRPGPATWLAERLEWLCYRRAARIVTITRGMREELIGRGLPAHKIVHVFQGTDISLCRPGPRKNAFGDSHGLNGKFVCLYTGNHGMVAGLEYVLSAAHLLQSERDVLFLLIGEGTDRPHLQRTARELSLDNVRFLEPVPKRMIADVIAASDVCLNLVRKAPCTDRFMPSKVFDYAGCGRPILSNVGGECADWLARYEAGMTTHPTDPATMAAAIRTLRDNPKQRRRMGENARRMAVEALDRRFAAEAFEDLLLEATAEKSSRPSARGKGSNC